MEKDDMRTRPVLVEGSTDRYNGRDNPALYLAENIGDLALSSDIHNRKGAQLAAAYLDNAHTILVNKHTITEHVQRVNNDIQQLRVFSDADQNTNVYANAKLWLHRRQMQGALRKYAATVAFLKS